jgi:photosystem II stability/assembly factor-like uncharacterized protein
VRTGALGDGERVSGTRIWGRAARAGLALGFALAVAGCGAEIYEERFAEREIDYYDDLYSATAVGADHLWVAGYFGSIYRTRDGGKSWTKLPSSTQKSIYGISFADEQNGWAIGRRGFIIHTTDGGDTWERQSTPRQPAQHMFAIHAIDASRAYMVGEWGGRYFTQDGGKTWEDHSFTVDESHPTFQYLTEFELEKFYNGETIYDDLYLNDVFFLDKNIGWIVGEYGLTYYTEDGGTTWEKGKILGDVVLGDIAFEAGSNEIPRERWKQLFGSAERLNEKEYLRVRIEGFLTEAELKAANGETYLADERAEAVRDFLEGEGVGQERIRLLNTTPLDQELIDMDAFARTKVSDVPLVKMKVIETPFLFDVKFEDETKGLVAGLGGVLLRTTDGGRTWRYSETDTRQALFAVGIGSNGPVAVGEKGVKRVSRDDGMTFERASANQFPQLFTYLRDLVFGDSQRGWIIGASGMVLRSSDGGATWHEILPPPAEGVAEDGIGE